MPTHSASETKFLGENAIELKYGDYSATLLPQFGGNLISFRDVRKGFAFLREPTNQAEFEKFLEDPVVFGIPVLFPPNRLVAGKMIYGNRIYSFPINEPELGNHIHGVATTSEWRVVEYGSNDTESFIVEELRFDDRNPAYSFFAHTFTLRIRYSLSADGLSQTFSALNGGFEELPFMFGYHTAFNAPFAPGSTHDDIRVHITIGERWELNERKLPTGQRIPLSEGEICLKSGSGNPYFEDLDNHYTSEPQNGRNYMELTDRKAKVRLVYDVGLKFKHWMVWNYFSNGCFFCPEPQTNLVNAPNSGLPDEESGLFALQPGETWTESCRIYVEDLKL